MAKRTQKRKNANAKPKGKRKGSRGATHALDAGAMAWARLLDDPCGAPLARPCYGLSASGTLTRVKQIVLLGGNTGAVDGFTFFQPTGRVDLTTSGCMVGHGYSITTGGALGVITGAAGPSFLSSTMVGSYRPVAGCIKALYTGTELNRSGIISVGIWTENQLPVGSTPSATAYTLSLGALDRARTGERQHEVKWVPAMPYDQVYAANASGAMGGVYANATVIWVAGYNVPAGSVSVEIDFVYEIIPEAGYGAPSIEAAPSRNSAQQVLSFLSEAAGGLTRWAISPPGRAAISRLGGIVAKTLGAPYAPLSLMGP